MFATTTRGSSRKSPAKRLPFLVLKTLVCSLFLLILPFDPDLHGPKKSSVNSVFLQTETACALRGKY